MIIKDINQAQYGDIILFEPTRLLSHVQVKVDNIKQPIKRNFSHGSLFWVFEGTTPLMIESVSGCGVHISRLNMWRNFIIIRPEGYNVMPKEEMAKYLNRRYDFSKIVSVMLNKAFDIPLTVDSDSEVICTELINLAYNYKLTPKGMCTPVTLANAIL